MNKDIKSARKIALDLEKITNSLVRLGQMNEAHEKTNREKITQLRALADRMEQQSKAEPVAYCLEDADGGPDIHGGVTHSLDDALNWSANEHIAIFPLYAHPPADARDAGLVEILKSALATAKFERHPFRPWHKEAEAAIAAKEGKE